MPEIAESRLRHLASGGVPGSMMHDDEFLLLSDAGFEPLGAVYGLSVVHLGKISLSASQEPSELEGYSQAFTSAVNNAVDRMLNEADTLGADGVYLLAWGSRHFDGEEFEYRCRGTAVRFKPRPGALRTPKGRPFLTGCSAVTLYQYLRRGFCPVSFRLVSCVYHVPHRMTRASFGQRFANVEVPSFTTGWYTAQETALARLQEALEADGSELNLRIGTDVAKQGDFGDYTAELQAYGRGWRRMPELTDLVPEVDSDVPGLVERSTSPAERIRLAREADTRDTQNR